jgi:hypothetical protein
VAQRGDRHYYFSAVFDEAADEYTNNPRVLMLYEMTEDEFREEADAHRRFEDIVGNTRHCFHLSLDQRHGPPGSSKDWERFYEKEGVRPKPDYESRPSVGWFSPD